MTYLGSLGTPNDRDEITFDYFGETMRVNPDLGELDYVDFMATAGAMDVDDVGSVKVVRDFAQLCLHADDFDRFWSTAKAHRQGVEQLFAVLTAIVEATSDRPTKRPSSSSATRSSTGTSYALPARLEGRPDLQLLLHNQQEAQAAEAG